MVRRRDKRLSQPHGYTSLHCPAMMRRNPRGGFVAYSMVFLLGVVGYFFGWSGAYLGKNSLDSLDLAHYGQMEVTSAVGEPSIATPMAVAQANESAESTADNLTVASYLGGGGDRADGRAVGSKESLNKTDLALTFAALGEPRINKRVQFEEEEGNSFLQRFSDGTTAYFTVEPRLQKYAQEILGKLRVPWGALVALDPRSGRILALADSSVAAGEKTEVALRATFPAASLFKLITSSAAVEESGLSGTESVYYRGGDYTLTRANFMPNNKSDRKSMTLATALGKSCNPVFARVALEDLAPSSLDRYARSFGFNMAIPFELPVQMSSFAVEADDYSIARTAAGFGEAKLSPLHAALVAAAFANDGLMMRPRIVDRVLGADGRLLYTFIPQAYRQVVLPSTAKTIMQMMKETTENGTARKYFKEMTENRYPDLEVAGKTGTLRGTDPEGTYFWFVGALPVSNPQLVVAALVIDPGYGGVKGTTIASKFVSYYLEEGYAGWLNK